MHKNYTKRTHSSQVTSASFCSTAVDLTNTYNPHLPSAVVTSRQFNQHLRIVIACIGASTVTIKNGCSSRLRSDSEAFFQQHCKLYLDLVTPQVSLVTMLGAANAGLCTEVHECRHAQPMLCVLDSDRSEINFCNYYMHMEVCWREELLTGQKPRSKLPSAAGAGIRECSYTARSSPQSRGWFSPCVSFYWVRGCCCSC